MKNKLTLTLLLVGFIALFAYHTVSCKKDEKPELKLSDTLLIIGSAANSVDTFTITSNTTWTVKSSESWLTINPESGSNSETITVTAEENTEISSRIATVTVTGEEVAAQTITVTQNGTTAVSPASLTLPSTS